MLAQLVPVWSVASTVGSGSSVRSYDPLMTCVLGFVAAAAPAADVGGGAGHRVAADPPTADVAVAAAMATVRAVTAGRRMTVSSCIRRRRTSARSLRIPAQ